MKHEDRKMAIMIRHLIMWVTVLIFFSCSFPIPRKLKREFNCYTGQYTGLDTLINIHGFYSEMVIRDHTGLSGMKDGKFQKLGIDTSYYSVIFFNDGLFIGNVGMPGLTASEHINKAGIEGGKVSGTAGTYEVSGDTIKVKYIISGAANNAWGGFEVWYKVIDKNTIVDFYRRLLLVSATDRSKEAYQPKMYSDSNQSKFVHVPNMPKSYNWLKDEKWFNCE